LSTGVIIISSFLTSGLSAIFFAGWSPGTCKMNILSLFNWFVFKRQHKQYFNYTETSERGGTDIYWKYQDFHC
jgi:TRAP-type C4-dicarboxylate transport system permease large subunit